MSKTVAFVVAILGLWATDHASLAQNMNRNLSISTDGGCRLYIGAIEFAKVTLEGSKGSKTIADITSGTFVNNENSTDLNDCTNYNGTITLEWTDVKYSPLTDKDQTKTALTSFTLAFDIIYQRQFGWWEVQSLAVNAAGEMIGSNEFHANWSGSVMDSLAIGASYKFGYACSKPNQLYYSENKQTGPVYQLQLYNIHLQPFAYPYSRYKDNFTDNVDDCVAFFSAGIWMTLLTLLIVVGVILSGVVMLSNMSTVNRFDDPREKQLVITAKE